MAEESRHAELVLNVGPGPPDDGRDRRVDTCPDCGGERWEILVIPDVFHCDHCKKGTVGPNTVVREREPEQLGFLVEAAAATPTSSGPGYEIPLGSPIDEGEAWMADGMPDE